MRLTHDLYKQITKTQTAFRTEQDWTVRALAADHLSDLFSEAARMSENHRQFRMLSELWQSTSKFYTEALKR
jgi:hypothetical protein